MDNQMLMMFAIPLALIIGYFLKKNPKVQNGSIPFINFMLSMLGQLLLDVSPASAGIFSGAFAHTVGQMLLNSAMITLISTGSHSTAKNTWQLMRDSFLAQAKEKAMAEASKPKP